jgi:hypothetical protein
LHLILATETAGERDDTSRGLSDGDTTNVHCKPNHLHIKT